MSYGAAGAVSPFFVARVDEFSIRAFDTALIATTQPNSRVLAVAAQLSPAVWTAPVDWTLQASQRSGLAPSAKLVDMSLGLIDRQLDAAAIVPVATITAAVGASCLYFQRDADLRETDTLIKGYLTEYGFTITTIDQDAADAAVIAASALVDLTFCSPFIFSSRGIKLADILSPLVIAKAFSADNLGMSGTVRGVDYDLTENPFLTNYEVVDTGHPLAAGLSGSIQPYTDNQGRATWSNPHTLAGAALAFKETTETRYFQYGLEPGYVFSDGSTTKPFRWTFNFVDSGFNFSADGEALIKAAIDYTVRAVPSPQIMVMLEIQAISEGAITLPAIAVSGSGGVVELGSGAANIPAITVSGQGSIADLGSGAATIPAISVSGNGIVNLAGSGDIQISVPSIQGIGEISVFGVGGIVLPSIGISGIGSLTFLGIGDILLPIISVSGSDIPFVPSASRIVQAESEDKVAIVELEGRQVNA